MKRQPTRIDLIRHGEPEGGRRYRGQIDDPLSDRGWRQMREAVGTERHWQRIVTSPLARCKAFALELGARHRIPVSEDTRLMEVGFGVWEGKTRQELETEVPGQVSRFYLDPVKHRPPGAEPLDVFTARVQAGFEDLLEKHAGLNILVVAHAGVIRAVIAHVLGAPVESMYRIQVDNAGISRLVLDGERPMSLVGHGIRVN